MWRWLFRMTPEQAKHAMTDLTWKEAKLCTYAGGDLLGLTRRVIAYPVWTRILDVANGKPTHFVCQMFTNVSCW